MNLIEIKNENEIKNLAEDTKTPNRIVVIYFTGKWCGPCRLFYPELVKYVSKIPANMASKVVFTVVDCGVHEKFSKANNINVVPTILFLQNKTILKTIIGPTIEKLDMELGKYTKISHSNNN